MSEQMRSEFEAWYLSIDEEACFDRSDYLEENYWCIEEQSAWICWQASRAALCVELPADKDISHNHEREAARLSHNDAVEACRDAIHAAGVKTK